MRTAYRTSGKPCHFTYQAVCLPCRQTDLFLLRRSHCPTTLAWKTSTLHGIEQTNVIRANYIAQLPSFLQPLLDAETPQSDKDSLPKLQIELWLAGFSTERFSVRLEDLWIIDDASPRIRWFDVKPYNNELALEAVGAPVVTANPTFA